MKDSGMGQGPNVVLDLVAKSNLVRGSDVFFDNLFTSFPLLNSLSELGYAGTGTLRKNRLNRIPIKTKAEMAKKKVPRGEIDVIYKGDIVLAVWKDNSPVYVASNKHSASTENNTCRRYNRVQKKYITVPQPGLINQYNHGMGGVDLLDGMVAAYRVSFHQKKWWFPIFR